MTNKIAVTRYEKYFFQMCRCAVNLSFFHGGYAKECIYAFLTYIFEKKSYISCLFDKQMRWEFP